jgi:hypothetical protein
MQHHVYFHAKIKNVTVSAPITAMQGATGLEMIRDLMQLFWGQGDILCMTNRKIRQG